MTILRMINMNNAWNANIKKKSKNNLDLQIYYRINTPAKMKTINTPGRRSEFQWRDLHNSTNKAERTHTH